MSKDAAAKFLDKAIDARKIIDRLRKTSYDAKSVVKIARKEGFDFDEDELKQALEEKYKTEPDYARLFCLSEPPSIE